MSRRSSRTKQPSQKLKSFLQTKSLNLSLTPVKRPRAEKKVADETLFSTPEVMAIRKNNYAVIKKFKKSQLRFIASLVKSEVLAQNSLKKYWKDEPTSEDLVNMLTKGECHKLILGHIEEIPIEDLTPKKKKLKRTPIPTPKNLSNISFNWNCVHESGDPIYLLHQIENKVFKIAQGSFVNKTVDPELYPTEKRAILSMCSLVRIDEVDKYAIENKLRSNFDEPIQSGMTVAWCNNEIVGKEDFDEHAGILTKYNDENAAIEALQMAEMVTSSAPPPTQLDTPNTPISPILPDNRFSSSTTGCMVGCSCGSTIKVLTQNIEMLQIKIAEQDAIISGNAAEKEYLEELNTNLQKAISQSKTLQKTLNRMKRPSDSLKEIVKFRCLSHSIVTDTAVEHFKVKLTWDDWKEVDRQSGKDKVKLCMFMLQSKYGVDFTKTSFAIHGASGAVMADRICWTRSRKQELVKFVSGSFPSCDESFVSKAIGQCFTDFDKEMKGTLEDEKKIFDKFNPVSNTLTLRKGGAVVTFEYVSWDGKSKGSS